MNNAVTAERFARAERSQPACLRSVTQNRLAAGILLLFTLIASAITFSREWLSYSTETDFLGAFLPDALRLSAGVPMALEFHPPLYSIVVASFHAVLGDWFQAALAVSVLASVATLWLSFLLLRRCLGDGAGLAALISLAVSGTYLTYTGFATSDLLFLLLYTAALYFAVRGRQAKSALIWLLAGIATGLALLTRSNGIILLLLMALPFFGSERRPALRHCLIGFVPGLLLPLMAWALAAALSGAPFAPSGNAVNVALTYFAPGEDRISGDARMLVVGRFDGLWDVISHDPVALMKGYLSDLFHVRPLRASGLFLPGLVLVLLAAFVWLPFRLPLSASWLFLVLFTLAHVLLINLKTFEPRYYLFIVPVLAAPLGHLLQHAWWPSLTPRLRLLTVSLIAATAIVSLVLALHQSLRVYRADSAEIASATHRLKAHLGGDANGAPAPATLYARKPHLAWYLGLADWQLLPYFDDVETLDAFLRGEHALAHGVEVSYAPEGAGSQSQYLFIGKLERRFRPQYLELLEGDAAGFERVAHYPETADPAEADWVLFRHVAKGSD